VLYDDVCLTWGREYRQKWCTEVKVLDTSLHLNYCNKTSTDICCVRRFLYILIDFITCFLLVAEKKILSDESYNCTYSSIYIYFTYILHTILHSMICLYSFHFLGVLLVCIYEKYYNATVLSSVTSPTNRVSLVYVSLIIYMK
jgi:hypothetical protein